MYSWLKIIKWTCHVTCESCGCDAEVGRQTKAEESDNDISRFFFEPILDRKWKLKMSCWAELEDGFLFAILSKIALLLFFPQRVLNLFSFGSGQIVHIITHLQRLFLKSWQIFLKNLNWKQLSLLLLFNLKKTQWVDFKPKSVVSNTRKKF